MVDKKLLDIIVCPETKSPLKKVDKTLVDKVNKLVEEGKLKSRSGQIVKEKIDGGLRTVSKGDYLYPIREEIPILLTDEAIPLTQIR